MAHIQLHLVSVNLTATSCFSVTRSLHPSRSRAQPEPPRLASAALPHPIFTLHPNSIYYRACQPLCRSPRTPPRTLRLYPPSLLPPTLFPLTKLALAPSIWSPFLQQPRTCSHLLSCWTALNISSDARAILALATSLSFNPSVRSELCLPPASAFFFKKRETPSRSEAKRIADATNLQTTPSLS